MIRGHDRTFVNVDFDLMAGPIARAFWTDDVTPPEFQQSVHHWKKRREEKEKKRKKKETERNVRSEWFFSFPQLLVLHKIEQVFLRFLEFFRMWIHIERDEDPPF